MDDMLTPTSDPLVVETRLTMPLAEAMLTQRAVRRVLPDPVDDGVVLRCLELALEAPTASNGQNWEFVVVRDRAVKAALAAQYRRAWSLYGGASRLVKTDEQTSKILKSVQWQVEHFELTGSDGALATEAGSWPEFHHDPQLTGNATN
jgi:nitroreductase